MPTRDIVSIDEDLCDGCGDCISACAEGAIALVDGKAKLVSDVYCDGLGACLGHCPQGAITVTRREAEPFDEAAVEQRLAEQKRAQSTVPVMPFPTAAPAPGGCPGSRQQSFGPPASQAVQQTAASTPSALRQWPVQLHLLSPSAPFLAGSDLLLAADCTAFAVGGFHHDCLQGRSLAIACPKLDSQQESYLDKLVAMIDHARIASLTVLVMEVPCCGGLVRLAERALAAAHRDVPLHVEVVSVRGEVVAG